MKKYRKKEPVVEAQQWNTFGDHPDVQRFSTKKGMAEGENCLGCKRPMAKHGWIVLDHGGIPVCPGDWIVEDQHGYTGTCRPDAFDAIYEEVKA